MLRRASALPLAWFLTLPLAAQDRTPLPGATGSLAAATWTIILPTELAAGERPGDPPPGPARDLLRWALAATQSGDAGEHLVLHQPGAAPASLRLVDAYSTPGTTTAADLARPDALAAAKVALEQHFTAQRLPFQSLGVVDGPGFPTTSKALAFTLTTPHGELQFAHHAVPAGDRIQYFETLAAADDPGAATAFATLLRSFDGARDGDSSTLRNMALGGLCGAIAGIVTARLRRRRQQALAAGGRG